MSRPLLLCGALVLILCFGVIDATSQFRSDYKYIDSTKAYYKHHQKNVPWEKAKTTCEQEGAFLYYPEKEEELIAVKPLYRNNIWIWLGASRQVNGQITSVDGKSINEVYNKWDLGEPNNLSGAENCIVLMDEDGKMNDYHCHALYSFVCKQYLNNIREDLLIMVVKDKTPKVGRRNFYQYYVNPKTWQEAKAECELNSGTLAYPEDELENGIIVDYTNQTYWRNWIWLGASKGSKFSSVDGRLLEDVYVNWGPREPVNIDGDENCVVLCRDGTYRAHNCEDIFPFICKTTIFVSAIKPEKGLMDPAILKDPSNLFGNVVRNDVLTNCSAASADCDTTCGKIDKDTTTNINFGSVVADQLKNFPSTKKINAMVQVMTVIEGQWSETLRDCKIAPPAQPAVTKN